MVNFNKNLERLDGILRRLEEGSLSLDEALADFERGVALVRESRKFLEEAQQKVTFLTRDGKEPPRAE
ncbi:MAG: exodeoxyribonuclease VII small subunit [Synergistaceae bacterium]|jgi:exodeoxyribonuclease VII small subunit|nr:exodeoxyribonuclease VII small subunit [Synergistaceae bacterium]